MFHESRFILLSAGYRYIHEKGFAVRRPEGAGNYAFVFFRSPAALALGGKAIQARENTWILFRPHTPQHYGSAEGPFANDWLHCEGEGLGPFLRELGLPLDTVTEAPDPMPVSRGILELSGLQRQEGGLREQLIDSELRLFFLRLRDMELRLGQTDRSRRYVRALTALRGEIYATPQERVTVEALAARLGLSKSYFQHLYKELFGVAVMADIIAARLEYAKYLLQSGSFTVAQVAALCGYENDVHFIRQFKKVVGVTPGRYGSL